MKSILQALDELSELTGLIPKDMHGDNVMTRFGTKDIVIMDVGLFGRQSRSTRLKQAQAPMQQQQTVTLPKRNLEDFIE